MFASEHVVCRSYFIQCAIGSQTKKKYGQQTTLPNESLQPDGGLLNTADNHFLWRQLAHHLLSLYFQLYASTPHFPFSHLSDLTTKLSSLIHHLTELSLAEIPSSCRRSISSALTKLSSHSRSLECRELQVVTFWSEESSARFSSVWEWGWRSGSTPEGKQNELTKGVNRCHTYYKRQNNRALKCPQ